MLTWKCLEARADTDKDIEWIKHDHEFKCVNLVIVLGNIVRVLHGKTNGTSK